MKNRFETRIRELVGKIEELKRDKFDFKLAEQSLYINLKILKNLDKKNQVIMDFKNANPNHWITINGNF